MLSATNWLDILKRSEDDDIGKAIVRLARLAERAHAETIAEGANETLKNMGGEPIRKDQAQAEGLSLCAVTPRPTAAKRSDAVRKEAGR